MQKHLLYDELVSILEKDILIAEEIDTLNGLDNTYSIEGIYNAVDDIISLLHKYSFVDTKLIMNIGIEY